MPDEPELVLHVWPAPDGWDLPSFNPACLAAILYLQLKMPGKFIVEETTNPDVSPDGQLPYLTHGIACIVSYTSVVKYVESLHRRGTMLENEQEEEQEDEDGAGDYSSPGERMRKSQETAWMAYVSAHLGDLVACHFFTIRHNYFDFSRRALASIFPVPQRYYVPDRLRQTYKPRLEAAGLWSIAAEEEEELKKRGKGIRIADNTAVKEAFGKAKVLETAQGILDILKRLLGDKQFFLDNAEPSPLDALIAAHILLLTVPRFPNNFLMSLVTADYPTLLAHADRIKARTISRNRAAALAWATSMSLSFEVVEPDRPTQEHVPLNVRSAPQASVTQIFSSLAIPSTFSFPHLRRKSRPKSKAEKEYDRMRWAWYGLAALSVVGWVWSVSVSGLRLVIVRPQDPEDLGRFERIQTAHDEGPEEDVEGDKEDDEYDE